MTVVLAAIVSIHEVMVFREISEEQQQIHLDERKEFIRDLINIEVGYIASQKELFDQQMLNVVQHNVTFAFNVAQELYETYAGKMDAESLKKLIINATSSIKNDNKFTEVFINDLDGKGVYYPRQ
ncbi:MAG TPA: cache domain-containing protein, partial [Sunxiuqinia sp.]|nr:cache domain-containing protein [Sunxiuqinia sp.]